ncbi:alpha/beta hydrolase [Mycobacterium hubeiense]|uniref:alpha/beta hydrolase n=1 Tax=Mycobacterium hubeiense TaxID=1867256 RepID=UPI000C7E8FA0|nr:alpha/beta fold hydrolase [Mycobacterium sp. QGD 101]
MRDELEVLEKGQCTDRHPAPLLFVHGAFHAAWCWENFLDYFAEQGYRALAVSLRGHGRSPVKRLRFCSLADYVEDVESVASSLPVSPVLIGHSMGGFIVQKYLERHEAPAAVLMASTPQAGARAFTGRLIRRYPWLTLRSVVTGNALHGFNTPAVARQMFFSAGTPESDVVRYAALLGNESQRVGFDAMRKPPDPARVRTPLLVLGADEDPCILADEVAATARAYGTQAQVFPAIGHDMMLEPKWADVAERIDSWLSARNL